MSKDRALVTAVYPNVCCKLWTDANGRQWYCDAVHPMSTVGKVRTIGYGNTAKAAWAAAAFTIALLSSGCATMDSKVISWNRMEHIKLQSMCKQGAETDLSKATIYGCAFWSNADNHCHIYTSDLMRLHSAQEQCVLGHEVTHCFDKNYHRGQLWHVDCTKAERK